MARKRSPKNALASAFDGVASPIYFLDRDGEILYCNAALAAWTGVPVDALIGRQVEYHSVHPPGGVPGVAAGLCPPPRVFSGEAATARVSCQARDGRLTFREGRFTPLFETSAGGARVEGALAVLETSDLAADAIVDQFSPGASSDELHAVIRRFRRSAASQYDPSRLVGESLAMRTVRRQIAFAAPTSAPVSIVGPPASGREHIAKAIHYAPPYDAECKFVAVDGATVGVDELRWAVEGLRSESRSEHRRNTLLIREVDQTSADVRAEACEMTRSNARGVRFIVTSAQALPRDAEDISTRTLAALFGVIVIQVPSLADRREDLPLLAHYFVEKWNQKRGRMIGGIDPDAIELLVSYAWPGGVVELADVIATAHENAIGDRIAPGDLPPLIHHAAHAAALPGRDETPIDLDAFLARIERELIERALRIADGNKTRAAELLGMNRPRFYRRLEQLGLLGAMD